MGTMVPSVSGNSDAGLSFGLNPMSYRVSGCLIGSLALTACTTPTFEANPVDYVFPAESTQRAGDVRKVSGLDIWENGAPDKDYRVLGHIVYSGKSGLLNTPFVMRRVVKVAKNHRRDALIILLSSESDLTLDEYGNPIRREELYADVITYEE